MWAMRAAQTTRVMLDCALVITYSVVVTINDSHSALFIC